MTTERGGEHGSGRAHIEALLRELAPQVLGALLHRFRDFASAEDAVQEALLAAAEQWSATALPDNPRGWLIQVAFRRMTDQTRSAQARRRREQRALEQTPPDELVVEPADVAPEPEQDDSLLLLYMCCHPALTQTSSIALTLRAVGGLTTLEIAKAFLVPEATMAQRISRAKQSIKGSGVPFGMPGEAERATRLGALLHVLYLIFNEGYTTSGGAALQRTELAHEAIRLTRLVRAQLPQHGEVAGLLALMLLTDARRLARSTPSGELVPLPEQDRSLWDRGAIDEGVALVSQTLSSGALGPYVLQAAIQAVHDEAARVEDTDWPQIVALYGVLARLVDNPMVTLNQAIAVAMVEGPSAGLLRLDALEQDARMRGHHRLAATRAHLLEMAGQHAAAIAQYRLAASSTTNLPEQHHLIARAARLAARNDASDET